MQIKVEGNVAKVFTPYNSSFVAKIKTIEGRKWDADEKCWTVPAFRIDTVREYMLDIYGETDVASSNKIDLRISFEKMVSEEDRVMMFGQVIAKTVAYKEASEGENAVFEEGQPVAEGTRKRPRVTIPARSIVKLHNVSENLYQARKEKGFNGYAVEVIKKHNDEKVNKDVLLEEKEKLLARLNEIEKLLSE